MKRKKYVFQITPQTSVRATQSDRVFFRIPKDELRPAGLKRRLRLERYNDYKISLAALARQQRFVPPAQGGHLIFYIPVSKSWRKHKKQQHHLQLHTEKPDWDNLAKAFYDSLCTEDKHIADVRVTKRWVNQEKGWIEFLVDTPSFPSQDNLM